jgi:hypothetical protein
MTKDTWGRVWRGSGISFAFLLIAAYVIRGAQPKIGASADALVSFYSGDRTRVLIGTFFLGLNLLNLLWFAAALSSDLREAGQGIWASAATASSAALGGLFFVLVTMNAALAFSIAGSGNVALMSALNDVVWVGAVFIWIPSAMLIMSGSFGLWQAKVISNGVFAAGVAAVVLVLVGSTTWASDGIWSPGGAYSHVIVPIVALVWFVVFSGILSARKPATVRVPESAVATPAMS